MKRNILVFIGVLLILTMVISPVVSAASDGAEPDAQGAKAKRTVMLYLCGSNLETESAMATHNLMQILNSEFSADGDVSFIVLTGGAEEWYMESEYLRDPYELGLSVSQLTGEYTVSNEYNQLWEAKGADAPEAPCTLTLLDADGITGEPGAAVLSEDELMTDPEVLRTFINYGVENHPAEKYDLILWDHGGGPTVGFGYDEHDYSSGMTFADIIDALSDNLVVDSDSDGVLDGRFDFIDFDACLMGGVELCFALADYADYYIASPETEPGYGQYYTSWLNKLGEDPDCDTFELSKVFVDSFMEYYTEGEGEGDYGTLTAYDLQKLSAPETGFVSAMSELQSMLKAQANTQNEDGEYLFYDELASVRDSFHYDDGNYIDLGNFASLLSIAALEPTDDWSNDYNEITTRILRILSQCEENDVIHAWGTDYLQTDFLVYRDENGEVQLGMMPVSGIYIYFPTGYTSSSDISDYCGALNEVIAMMPDSDRKDFLAAYCGTVVDYSLIKCTGEAVCSVINKSGVDKSEVDFDSLYEYWNELPPYYSDKSYSQWNRSIKALFNLRSGATWDETVEWINGIIRQQADEAITADNITVDRIHFNYGDEYILHLSGADDRVVQCAVSDIFAELPALEAYIDEYQPNSRLYYEYAGMLRVGTVYGMIYGGELYDSDEAPAGSDWMLSSFEQKWYAVNDTDGLNHVAAIDKSDENGVRVPALYGSVEEPQVAFLEFRYADYDSDELVLDTIWFKSSHGSMRGTKAKELTEELTVCPMIYASYYVRDVCIPISENWLTVTKDNYSSVKLVYADISDIPDIADVDDDGSAFYSTAAFTDIYGNQIDVSYNVAYPDRELVSISLAEITPAAAGDEELAPVVEYDGRILQEGVDYTWEKKNSSDDLSAPGEYRIALTGKGSFVGKAVKVFTVAAPAALLGDVDGDGEVSILDATAIQRHLVDLPVDSFVEEAADADGDGEISILDATAIQRWLVSLPSNENIGKPIA